MPLPRNNVGRVLQTLDDGGGVKVLGLDEAAGLVSGMRSRIGRGVPSDSPPGPALCGTGGSGWDTPSPQKGGPSLPGFLPKETGWYLMPGGEFLGMGNEPDQPPDPFCAPPYSGHTCDPGGW